MKACRITAGVRIFVERRILFFFLFLPAALSADFFDEAIETKPAVRTVFLGGQLAATGHVEEGLDSSKGEYSVSHSSLGGSVIGEYHLSEFYAQAGIGLMRLTGLRVNGYSQSMQNRVQWHVPVFVHAYCPLGRYWALGAGFTHLTETRMYLNAQAVPESSFHHLFLDTALQVRPQVMENLFAVITAIVGLNLIPGRQHTYSVGDLLHLRFQLMAGMVYATF